MKRLGVNQKLHEIFNRVLNKPEHEGKPHQFGDFIFTFNRVTLFNIEREISSPTKITQVDGFYFNLLYRWRDNCWDQWISPSCQAQCNLTDMMKKVHGYEEKKIEFRKQFTAYLNYLDMNEKLGDGSGKKSVKSKI
ncbi:MULTISPECIES: hypothetical protein [Burkholderiaceae]|uniref:hypothetical protein n=1 Tax=Burkholderiaceae TaxID=119060 RepID=UPI0011787349|nr:MULTISPECIES: hypothetical protein [Burkholderiaceae]MBY4717499.1 hypothetical protein [Ralstonia mannitolilytica]